MKLIEALNIIANAPSRGADLFNVTLACGFTPLHLSTFLHAELQLRMPDRRVKISSGAYGDLLGTLRFVTDAPLDGLALVIEWADLDARLGIRQLGGWGPRNLPHICDYVRTQLAQLEFLLDKTAGRFPIAVCLPTLPLPPLFTAPGREASAFELQLKENLAAFAERIARKDELSVINAERLDRNSAANTRLDVNSSWTTGFPYQLPHAHRVAQMLADLIRNPLPKRGLITDLDHTLWNGIVGEVGAGGIDWDLDHHSQSHGLYQQFLRSLSEEGVLIGVASKNDPVVVEEAMRRPDLLIPKEQMFPMEIGWRSKAEAVRRILEVWNVGPESVVFVDDTPAELAEIETAFPGLECIRFPYRNPEATYDMLCHLRDLFGRRSILAEDTLRLESIRAGAALRRESRPHNGDFSEALLEKMEAELTISFSKDAHDRRAFELVNKTNQFNLNGRRYTEAAWQQYLRRPDVLALTVRYTDRFGSLGKIAVLAGRLRGSSFTIDTWVLSCRAFARRIEHQCLRVLFETFSFKEVECDFAPTSRNVPARHFFETILGVAPEGAFAVSRDVFQTGCPKLYHHVVEEGALCPIPRPV